jgi:hypothetical protein
MKIFPLWLFSFCSLPLLAFGQGPLTPPPGAPWPTMKTLDQVEARTPIPGPAVGLVAPFVINQSGSYYLTGNIAVPGGDAIRMSADGVTLDLNGFTISSSAGTANGTAIKVVSGSNITIRNGFISGTTTVSGSTFSGGGFLAGIGGLSLSTNVTVERISVRGIGGDGISLAGTGTVVRSCCTNITSGRGIFAELVTNSIAEAAGGTEAMFGITVSGCRATNVSAAAFRFGIVATLCTDSTGTASTSAGISTESGVNCDGFSTNSTGLSATNASNCTGSSTNSTGLFATNATNCSGTTTSTLASVFGLDSFSGTLTGCRGVGSGGSGALRAFIAIGCTFSGGAASITNKYNMP